MADPEKLPMPAPIVQATDADAHLFGDLTDPHNPATAMHHWVSALNDRDQALLDAWSAVPGQFDVVQLHELFAGYPFTSRVLESEEPDRLVGMRLILDDVGGEGVVIVGPMLVHQKVVVLWHVPEGWRILDVADEPPSMADLRWE